MNIREYFEELYKQAGLNEDEFDKVLELEQEVYEMDDESFERWAIENDIDLTARDEHMQELIVTLWGWDMCGD